MIPTLFGIMLINFLIVQTAPGGPVEQAIAQITGEGADITGRITQSGSGETLAPKTLQGSAPSRYRGAQGLDPEFIKELEQRFGFDKPMHERFFLMVKSYIVFDFGESFFRDRDVVDLVLEKMPVSISLGLWTTLLVYLISIPLGIAKARRDGSRFDMWTSFAIVIGTAIPSFLFAVFLLIVFSGGSYLDWFPLRDLVSENWDELSLGDKITVQESDWNCVLMFTPNQKRKPFDNVRVRKALNLAVDRWGGSKYLSQIAIVKTVGGVVFPGHPLAATKAELEKLAGYWPSLEKSRAEARRLLKEAGFPNGFSFTFHNRAVDQPYKIVGTWLIDQWRQIGLKVKQRVQPTGPFYATLRKKKDFDVSMDFNCQSIVNPLLDVSKWQSDTVASNQHAGFQDPQMDKWFDQMNRSGDPVEQRRIMRL